MMRYLRPVLLSAASLACLAVASGADAQTSQGVQDSSNAGTPGATDGVPLQSDPAVAGAQVASPAADSAPAASGEVVVTGIRASLASALAIKRRAGNVVDSITAEDAGKFPENNLAESLQRIAGVSVVRSFGLGQQVSVRGLGPDFTNVLLNGRSLPSDTGAFAPDGGGRGRSFNFDVLPSEMISRLDVNKTSLPQLTEGGIGSTINIITPRPLDGDKSYASLTVQGNVVSKVDTVRPTASGIASWQNGDRTFGVAVSGSYTDLRASEDYIRVGQWDAGAFNVISGGTANPFVSQQSFKGPRQISYGVVRGGTKRYFGSGSVQWKPTDKLLLTADGFYSELHQRISDSILNPIFGNTVVDPVVSSNGVLVSGTYPGQTFLNSPAVAAALATARDANGNPLSVVQPQTLSVVRARDRVAKSYDVGLNARWEPTDQLTLEADASFAKSTGNKPDDPYILVGNYAQSSIGYQLKDGNPLVTDNDAVLRDPSLARIGTFQNYGQRVDDRINEGRFLARYRFESSFLSNVEIGGDYQDHLKGLKDYSNPSDSYNTLTFPFPTSLFRPVSLGTHFLSGDATPPANSFIGYDPAQLAAYLSQAAQLNSRGNYSSSYLPQTDAAGNVSCTGNCALIAADPARPGGPFALVNNPGGSFATQEKVAAGYVNAAWRWSRLSGNVGVRVVHVDTLSTGFGQTVTGFQAGPSGSYTFAYSPATELSGKANYTSALPSGNIRFDLTDRLVLRAAAARTLTRADLNDLRFGDNWSGSVGNLSLSRGNPGLKPQFGNNYDLSAEWYISSINYVSAAAFRKDLRGLFQAVTTEETIPGAPETVFVTQTRNVSDARVQGVEVAGQYALDERFGWAQGFGVTGNYTHVEARTSTCGFTGLSPDTYNASGFYDNGRIQTRLSYNWRSKWITSCNFDNEGVPQYHASYGQLDLALRFNLSDTLQIFADATNLTNSNNFLYAGSTDQFIERNVNYSRFDLGLHITL
ncbi:TonB-dependent receptor [Sphingomonas sp. BK580]|uniref:TonB-dependent receptor n=1 Tax=Sphingomonas sp. BK580 TaxID=2586972 RepID=UPI00160B6FCE|nr:TonB-dependent receptor [Sphingomonas sp. BK580]MBB3694653.1 TonB-dependent receptor [Sphingomonas sp. BK580]